MIGDFADNFAREILDGVSSLPAKVAEAVREMIAPDAKVPGIDAAIDNWMGPVDTQAVQQAEKRAKKQAQAAPPARRGGLDTTSGAKYMVRRKVATDDIERGAIKWKGEADIERVFRTGLDKQPADQKPTWLGTLLHKIQRGFLRAVEPSKLTEMVDPETYTAIVRMTHMPEAGALDWSFNTLADFGDMTFAEFREELEKLSDRQIADVWLSRGQPFSAEGKRLKAEAWGRMTPQLKKIAMTLQQIYDTNWAVLQSLGIDAVYYEEYFYGSYKNDKKAQQFVKNYMTTTRFTKEKKLPSVADALAYGLKLKDRNPIDNARRELMAIHHLAAMRRLEKELVEKAYNVSVIKKIDASEDQLKNWESIDEPQLIGLLFHPDVARFINNMIAVNKTSKGGWKVFRDMVHGLNALKFLLPFFHLRTIFTQGITDSGIGGIFIPTRWKVFRKFKKNDDIFRSPQFREYVELGGGQRYSVESASRRLLQKWLTDSQYHWSWRAARSPARYTTAALRAINEFVFERYIPAVQFTKYLQQVDLLEKKYGKPLTKSQKIKIIKETQYMYGEMNERLFGRSPTVTSALRFFFLAPGFREGNYRTMYRALSVAWDKKLGPTGRSWRSLLNIPQYLLFTAICATIGTFLMTGELPKWPKDEDELRDIFKVKTRWKDYKDRDVYIDLMTSEKDYFEQLVKPGIQLLTGRPLEAAETAVETFVRTIGGMKSTTLGVAKDLASLAMGEVLVDWKGERVYYLTDPAMVKLNKILMHLWERAEPIPSGTYRRMRDKNVNAMVALLASAAGIRASVSEYDKKKIELWSKFYSLRNNRDELMKVIRAEKITPEQIVEYNDLVDNVMAHPLVDDEMRKTFKDLKLKSLDFYAISAIIRDRDDTLNAAADLLENHQPAEARRLLSEFNRKHPGAVLNMKTVVDRINHRRRKARLPESQKERQRVPRDIRRALTEPIGVNNND